jgi:hypothetical protein
MTLVTIYSLFGDDIRLVGFNATSDNVFYTLTTFSLICFLVEVILSSIIMPGYFLSFFFWLDFCATITMILDIGWIWDALTGTQNYSVKNAK